MAGRNRDQRIFLVDLLRGVAIALMVVFHLSWDLDHFGWVEIDFHHDPFWLNFRTLIVTLFLTLVGVSLHIAHAGGVRWVPYLRRLLLLVMAAGAVTVASHYADPQRLIVFGILHFIAFASILALPLVWRPRLALVLGVSLLLMPRLFSHPLFDHPSLHWIGLGTRLPITNDFVPVLPWLGVVAIGVAIGRLLREGDSLESLRLWRTESSPGRLLALAGRHGLLIYLLHQPLLYGTLWLIGG
ncbi:MAG TPA: DUF1624 domain-containing protein [Thiotrichales bacterium]|nr:DUF1624 domain-containing protein [Thiotrichales bacterium]